MNIYVSEPHIGVIPRDSYDQKLKCTPPHRKSNTKNRIVIKKSTFGMTRRCGALLGWIEIGAPECERSCLRTSILSSEFVQRIVTLALRPDLTTDSERCRGGESPAGGINISDTNLDRGVVLRGD